MPGVAETLHFGGLRLSSNISLNFVTVILSVAKDPGTACGRSAAEGFAESAGAPGSPVFG
jgi:hypothetical protein